MISLVATLFWNEEMYLFRGSSLVTLVAVSQVIALLLVSSWMNEALNSVTKVKNVPKLTGLWPRDV